MKFTVLTFSILLNLILGGWLAMAFVTHGVNTIYASEYSETKFDQVDCRADQKKVRDLLGEPLYEYQRSSTGETISCSVLDKNATKSCQSDSSEKSSEVEHIYWVYSEQGHSLQNYQLRGIRFDKEGRIIKVVKELYVD